MDFELRKLVISDLFQLAECESQVFNKPWKQSAIKIQLENEYALNLGCFYSSHLVGYLLANAILGESELFRIGTLPSYQKHGIGLALMNRYFLESDSSSYFLEVEADNISALSLYKKCGYQPYSIRKDYYGPSCDAILMKRELL